MDNEPDKFERWADVRIAMVVLGIIAISWIYLLIHFPTAWFFLNVAIFVALTGLFLCRVVIGIKSPLGMLFASPILGSICLLFVWLLTRLVG